MSIIQGFLGKDLADDPIYQERLKAGQIKPPRAGSDEPEKPLPNTFSGFSQLNAMKKPWPTHRSTVR